MTSFFHTYKIIILGIISIIVVGIIFFYVRNPLVPKLTIGNTTFTYELALTPAEVTLGLSGHTPLAATHGMLFVFNHKEQFHFWMKDMTFPLDMIWIDDTKVVDISKNVPVPVAGQTLPIFTPKQVVNRVFEVNAGTADKLGIKEGDTVTYLRK